MRIILTMLLILSLLGCDQHKRHSNCGRVIEIGMCSERCAVKVEWQTGVVEIVRVSAPVMENMVVYEEIKSLDQQVKHRWISPYPNSQYPLATHCPFTNVVME